MDYERYSSPQELETQTEKEFRGKLRGNKNKIFAVNLVGALLKKLDGLVTYAKHKRQVKFACKAGCNHCCTLRVEPTIPEIFYIATRINKYPDAEKSRIIRNLEIYTEKVKGLSPQQHKALGVSCVFLKDGVCSIYDFRPFACRKWHSLDVTRCEASSAEVPLNKGVVTFADAMLRGFSKAYEKSNLPILPSEFGQAVLMALTDESAIEHWMQGEAVFPRLPEYDDARGSFIASDRPQ
ncbi:MAG TPA: YkgJ family cysteine cluster protein [Spongiibacteraceae bacterium]|nr:YkgJ family cysteine cluster protein [Spongiibacteraceae bacterium]